MKNLHHTVSMVGALAAFASFAACSDGASGGTGSTSPDVSVVGTPDAGASADVPTGTATPDAGMTGPDLPRDGAAVATFLASGAYKSWRAEGAVHDARSPSPHGFNRVYSNPEIANAVDGSGAWPVGAAAVKELYASADADSPIGYAYYLKTAADSAGGASWYWYETTDGSVVADGLGNAGVPKRVCVGCHAGAGTDAAHTPSVGSRDFVYTPVR